ncbi:MULTISPECIES: signal peptidase II [Shewanella]|jgi:signal peptidase II|uniref:Lipoprotein signal peptidase n=8 Tax=Shewanella TaxID=22 RepID=LSPA_SHESM|nr:MULTISPECIES: signal peptidase II [Shewanella]Q0HFZ0.1 RecName: Full=Lipoprotein signal peptidase; AltName: Full=Prolipoprotein signal peptidase; AltName: Full=Signal peptidase II; Short=SPase II [Shewanella sp. MR-4]Q0HS83.1 RecName: Full=Lipoprotein signal peptidase; AltName: Full=Prolipoprotein signal peptidase; AltName: Full=Signal peptidase II; Short=SPase II [Shewanella sp. MR-7]QXN25975.1 signal peptidase II [Shewanella putrefaciens]ABI40027.1 signal peptidase II. Aspartic peptidase. 
MPLTWKDSGLRWYWVVVLVFLADQLSKQWVLANFDLFESVKLLPFFNFTYVRNYGAAFSFLSEAGGWQRWLFTLVAVGFSTLLTVWLRKQSASLWKLNLAYTLVIGGALGNLIDRLMHGFVVDFIDFYWGKSHYPAFNIADSAIFIGAVLIIWDSFFNSKSEQDKTEEVK